VTGILVLSAFVEEWIDLRVPVSGPLAASPATTQTGCPSPGSWPRCACP